MGSQITFCINKDDRTSHHSCVDTVVVVVRVFIRAEKKVLMGITLISFYKRKWELCKVIYERAPVQGPGVINFSTISKQPSINSVSSSLLVLTFQEPRGFHSKQRRPRQSEANATSPISTMICLTCIFSNRLFRYNLTKQ